MHRIHDTAPGSSGGCIKAYPFDTPTSEGDFKRLALALGKEDFELYLGYLRQEREQKLEAGSRDAESAKGCGGFVTSTKPGKTRRHVAGTKHTARGRSFGRILRSSKGRKVFVSLPAGVRI